MNKNKNGIVEDSFQSFLVDGAEFTDIQEEYPIIREDMVSIVPPIKVMPFEKAINYHGDLSNTFIHFYSKDKSFERVRRNPNKYLSFFRKTAGLIGFDFSVHTDMPVVKQKSQMNDNQSLTFYFASKGIPCIPNFRCGINELRNEYSLTFPKKALIAIGTHGFVKMNYQKAEWYCLISYLINELKPSGIIVIGSLPEFILKDFSQSCKFYLYKSWMEENRKEFYDKGSK